jgi:quinol monooxygenase YgiN
MPRCAILYPLPLSLGRERLYPAAIAGGKPPIESKGADAMIHVLAIITTKPGKRDEVLGHFRANMAAVHAEAGCIEYGPVIDAEGGPGAKFGADTFVVVEKWESLEHLGAHARSPHMAAYAAKTKDLLANREIHVCQPAA